MRERLIDLMVLAFAMALGVFFGLLMWYAFLLAISEAF